MQLKDEQTKILLSYENDEEIDNDLDKVWYWYHKAAENHNNGVSLYKLGEFYESGKGVGENKARAFAFYKEAAEKGNTNGKYKLGYCYEHGFGTYADTKKAIDLYKEAAKKGHSDAQKRLLYEF